jgi:hypothetical protein
MTAFAPGSLFAFLAQFPDPRSPHGRRFSLISLLASACPAVLGGQTSYTAIAQGIRNQPTPLLQALGFFRKPPTDDAFRYLFSRLDLAAFETARTAWVAHLIPVAPEQLRPTPLDGKILWGSDDKLRGAVHLLALLDGPSGGIRKQGAVAATTNEHKAAFDLLRGMILQGRLITADAMVCHRDFAQQIRDQGGHYFFAVTDNQEQLQRDIASAFAPAFSPLRRATPPPGGRRGTNDGALRRSGRDPDAPDDNAVERLPGRARRGVGVPAGAHGQAQRERDA